MDRNDDRNRDPFQGPDFYQAAPDCWRRPAWPRIADALAVARVPGKITDKIIDKTCSAEAIQWALDCSGPYISRLSRDNIVKKKGRGEYWILQTVRNYIQYLRSGPGKTDDNQGKPEDNRTLANRRKQATPVVDPSNLGPIDAARFRKLSAEAEKTELALLETAGQLVRAVDVSRAWADMLARCRQKILSIPTKVAPNVQDETKVPAIEAILRAAVDEALAELASFELPGTSIGNIPDERDPSAAQADS